MDKYIILEKAVGETPLSSAEAYRANHPELDGVPMAYAGRLDPMASGKLLVLLGAECKNQTAYHGLDKEYEFSILFGISSDSLDVLGRLTTAAHIPPAAQLLQDLPAAAAALRGTVTLPYPRFSAKTVQGKPLHTWTMEGRLAEIEIPTKESTVYTLEFLRHETLSRTDVVDQALEKVNSIPPVTELRKALGNDFRRVDVRQDWENIRTNTTLPDTYLLAHFSCAASSGTYMRTLASELAKKLDTSGLAWRIHRTKIGTFGPETSYWNHEF